MANNESYYWVGRCKQCGEMVNGMMSGGVKAYCSDACRTAARRAQWAKANAATGKLRSRKSRLRKRIAALNDELRELGENAI